MSLDIAMLATSNVPVWAAEFSDGTDAAVATEAPAAEAFSDETADAPVVDDTTDAAPASIKVNEADMSLDLSAEKDSITWGTGVTDKITGTIAKTDGSAVTKWSYRWVDENNIAVADQSKTVTIGTTANTATNTYADMKTAVESMSLEAKPELAGKKLTLYIYDTDASSNQTLYDINTGITVSVEKQDLSKVATIDLGAAETLTYNGFAQAVNTAATTKDNQGNEIPVVNVKVGSDTINAANYTLSSTSATNAGEKVTVTATAAANSAYTGTVSKDVVIGQKSAELTDTKDEPANIVANPNKGLSYQYTGGEITIANKDVTVKESKSDNNGEDKKFSGADLSNTIISAKTTDSVIGDTTIDVRVDGRLFKNFSNIGNPQTLRSSDTVEIKKRDLSAAGTKLIVDTITGQIPTDITASELITKGYLKLKGTE